MSRPTGTLSHPLPGCRAPCPPPPPPAQGGPKCPSSVCTRFAVHLKSPLTRERCGKKITCFPSPPRLSSTSHLSFELQIQPKPETHTLKTNLISPRPSYGEEEGGGRERQHPIEFPTTLSLLAWEEWNSGAGDLSASSPRAWVVSSKGAPRTRERVFSQAALARICLAKHLRLLTPQCSCQRADIVIAPPAGSSGKASETPGLAVTSSFTNLLIIFNTSHFVLLHKFHRLRKDSLGGP